MTHAEMPAENIAQAAEAAIELPNYAYRPRMQALIVMARNCKHGTIDISLDDFELLSAHYSPEVKWLPS